MLDIERELKEVKEQLADILHFVAPLAELLVHARDVSNAKGLHRNTIGQNQNIETFTHSGSGVLLKLEAVSKLQKRRKKRKTKVR